jgi:hypothetical protein
MVHLMYRCNNPPSADPRDERESRDETNASPRDERESHFQFNVGLVMDDVVVRGGGPVDVGNSPSEIRIFDLSPIFR